MAKRRCISLRKTVTVWITLLFIGLSGCQTTSRSAALGSFVQRPGESREPTAVEVFDHLGVSGIVEYLPPSDLIEDYGDDYTNPFVAPLAVIAPVEFLVFRLTVTAMNPDTLISVHDSELRFGGNIETAAPPSTIERFWEIHDDDEDLKAHERSRRDHLIRSEMLGFDIQDGDEPVSGLIVFVGRFPDYGTLQLRFPLVDENYTPIDYITVEIELNE